MLDICSPKDGAKSGRAVVEPTSAGILERDDGQGPVGRHPPSGRPSSAQDLMFTFPPNSLAAQKLESFNKVESIKEGTRRGCYCRAPSRSRRKGRARAWRTSKGRSTNGDLRASP